MFEERRAWIWLFAFLLTLIIISPMLRWGIWTSCLPGMMGMMGYGWGYMSLIPIAFLILVILGAYYFMAGFMETGRPTTSQDKEALVILNERYAKGEITKEQYLRMKKEVES